MASSNMSKDLQELIKSIGETKSKQEEDRIILHELSTLKSRINEKNISPKKLKEHLIRALYIEMLGHSASFSHIEAINLTQSKNLILKRIGYLLCSLFLNKNSDLTIMLVSTIQKDLNSSNVHEVVMCLTSLDLILNSTIATAISESIVKLIGHQTDLIRKKAILVLQKIVRIILCLARSEWPLRHRLQRENEEGLMRSRAKCDGSLLEPLSSGGQRKP